MTELEKPFEGKSEVVAEAILRLKEASEQAPDLEGVPTGVEGLDDLFFTVAWRKGRAVRRSLGGIPRYAVMNLTGVADTGKSLMVEQYALTQAGRGERVAFVTVESPAPFVAMGMKARARAMGLDPEVVEENVVFLDAASAHRLREDLPSLLATLAYAIKTYKIRHTVVDSITGLYEHREMLARQVVRRMFNFLKKWHQTALLVSQKRSGHEEFSAEAAGGYAVAHIVDGTMVLTKEVIDTPYKERLYGLALGEVVRLFRIDGCRLSGHDTHVHLLEITEAGLVKVGPSLTELRRTIQKEDKR